MKLKNKKAYLESKQKWFDKHAPNGKTEMLANSAHLSWFEQPEKYTDLITRFVLSLYC